MQYISLVFDDFHSYSNGILVTMFLVLLFLLVRGHKYGQKASPRRRRPPLLLLRLLCLCLCLAASSARFLRESAGEERPSKYRRWLGGRGSTVFLPGPAEWCMGASQQITMHK